MQLAISIPVQKYEIQIFDVPLSKLNAIEIREAGRGNSEASVHYGLYCACCKQFITNSNGYSASISQLVDLLHIADDVYYATCCYFREKIDNQNVKSSPQPTYTSMCFDPPIYEKLDHDVLSQNIEFVKCNALNSSSEKISLKALELINALEFDKLTYPASSTIKSQWIDAIFKSISWQQVVTSI